MSLISSCSPVVIDTGCTRSVTPFRNDFDTVIDTSNDQEMVGLKDGVSIKGEGHVNWTIRDAFGHLCAIRTRACYVPEARVRLLSPMNV